MPYLLFDEVVRLYLHLLVVICWIHSVFVVLDGILSPSAVADRACPFVALDAFHSFLPWMMNRRMNDLVKHASQKKTEYAMFLSEESKNQANKNQLHYAAKDE